MTIKIISWICTFAVALSSGTFAAGAQTASSTPLPHEDSYYETNLGEQTAQAIDYTSYLEFASDIDFGAFDKLEYTLPDISIDREKMHELYNELADSLAAKGYGEQYRLTVYEFSPNYSYDLTETFQQKFGFSPTDTWNSFRGASVSGSFRNAATGMLNSMKSERDSALSGIKSSAQYTGAARGFANVNVKIACIQRSIEAKEDSGEATALETVSAMLDVALDSELGNLFGNFKLEYSPIIDLDMVESASSLEEQAQAVRESLTDLFTQTAGGNIPAEVLYIPEFQPGYDDPQTINDCSYTVQQYYNNMYNLGYDKEFADDVLKICFETDEGDLKIEKDGALVPKTDFVEHKGQTYSAHGKAIIDTIMDKRFEGCFSVHFAGSRNSIYRTFNDPTPEEFTPEEFVYCVMGTADSPDISGVSLERGATVPHAVPENNDNWIIP